MACGSAGKRGGDEVLCAGGFHGCCSFLLIRSRYLSWRLAQKPAADATHHRIAATS
jgi:hypothetical protein